MGLRLLSDGVENPANRARITDVAGLLGASCVVVADGRLIAVENTAQAAGVYGRRSLRGTATLAVGHERRGVSRAVLAAAEETVMIPTVSPTVTTLNVAAAAAVAGWYVLRGSGPQARAAHPGRRWPVVVVVSGDDHVEVGSCLRSAAAFGLREVWLADPGGGWFDGPHAQRREARAAARRHKNPLRVRRAPPGFTAGFGEIVVITPWGAGRPIARERLARGQRQAVVIGVAPEQLDAGLAGRVRVATLGLEETDCAPLRLVASIALAEIARQVGRTAPGGPTPTSRWPTYQREIKLAAEGELVFLDPAVLLGY